MVSYHDVPECDQAVLVNVTEGLDFEGRAKPRPWRLGMGLTLVGTVCFLSYWSGLSIRHGAELATPQDHIAKLKRAIVSFAETASPGESTFTQHFSINLGPEDGDGEPDQMTVKLTLEPPDDDAEDAEAAGVMTVAFKYKEGKGDEMKEAFEAAFEARKKDMPEDAPVPEVSLDEEKGLCLVVQQVPMSEEEMKDVEECDLLDDKVVFEMATERDLAEMVEHREESAMTVHGGIKAKVEVSMMKKIEEKMEEMAAAEAEEALGKEGQMVAQVVKLIRSFGLDASFKYSATQLGAVASSMNIPTFEQVLQLMVMHMSDYQITLATSLKDSADGLDHVTITGLPKSPNFLLEFTNFHLTDFLLAVVEATTSGEGGEADGEGVEADA